LRAQRSTLPHNARSDVITAQPLDVALCRLVEIPIPTFRRILVRSSSVSSPRIKMNT